MADKLNRLIVNTLITNYPQPSTRTIDASPYNRSPLLTTLRVDSDHIKLRNRRRYALAFVILTCRLTTCSIIGAGTSSTIYLDESLNWYWASIHPFCASAPLLQRYSLLYKWTHLPSPPLWYVLYAYRFLFLANAWRSSR